MTATEDAQDLWNDFHQAVNMTSPELRDFLAADEDDPAEQGAQEQEERELGAQVLRILGKRRTDLTSEDVEVMRTVVERVRELDPDPDVAPEDDDEWRRTVMRLGHDPLKARL